MKQFPCNILIVLHGAIGDVVRALPLAGRIKRYCPDTRLSWAVEPKSLPIVEGHRFVDKVYLFDRPRGLPAYRSFIKSLRKERFDCVLDLQRHFKSGVTSRLSGAPRRIGFNRKNAKEFNWLFSSEKIEPVENFSSKLWHYQKFGDVLGIPAPDALDFGCRPCHKKRESVDSALNMLAEEQNVFLPESAQRVGLIVGSSWASRLWFADAYADCCREMYRRWGAVGIIVGGPAERQFAQSVKDICADLPLVDATGRFPLEDLFALFTTLRAAVGSDSGPMHMAAAVGLPVISLWGSTSPLRSCPHQNKQSVLQSPIGCTPCYRRNCPGLERLCMRSIPATAVVAMLHTVFESRTVVE